ncbi:MAG TPA: anti-sigma factor [Candidatus Sulfotelmatobacter sp.]|nr:anti-sigma factor [Candidatus Sulfotelmatobacter sp.]
MNCVELQASLAEIEDGRSIEQRAHLKNCPDCSALVTELILIASTAVELRGAQEPSPHVWKAIETTLRQEGVIRPQKATRSLLPALSSRWGWARWVVPAAAAFLVTVGLYVRQHSMSNELERSATPVASGSDVAFAGLNDDDLLQEVAAQTPAMQAQYADNLRRVNEYIQDAKNVVAANPNDEEARRSLMEAYQQKAMLFELAMDRSLP